MLRVNDLFNPCTKQKQTEYTKSQLYIYNYNIVYSVQLESYSVWLLHVYVIQILIKESYNMHDTVNYI